MIRLRAGGLDVGRKYRFWHFRLDARPAYLVVLPCSFLPFAYLGVRKMVWGALNG